MMIDLNASKREKSAESELITAEISAKVSICKARAKYDKEHGSYAKYLVYEKAAKMIEARGVLSMVITMFQWELCTSCTEAQTASINEVIALLKA